MVWSIGGVDLPCNPKSVRMIRNADIKSRILPPNLPLLISLGSKADKLQLQGWLAEEGKTKDELRTTYKDPLDALIHTKVQVASNTGYDGEWIMAKCDITESTKYASVFVYKIELWRGSMYVVYTG